MDTRKKDSREWIHEVMSVKECDIQKVSAFLKEHDVSWDGISEYIKFVLGLFPGCAKMVQTPGGDIAGVCFGIPADETLGHISTLRVRKDLRRRGIGTLLVKMCLEFLGDRNVCLRALPDILDFYAKFGFKLDEKCLFQIWRGHIKRDVIDTSACQSVIRFERMSAANITEGVIPFCKNIMPLDHWCTLEKFVGVTSSVLGLIAYRGSTVVGFGYLLRPISEDHLGSLRSSQITYICMFADTFEIIPLLFGRLVKEILEPEFMIEITIPVNNPQARSFVEKKGFKKASGPFPMMYTREPLSVKWNKIYSIVWGIFGVI